jgi:hypothetical protein
MPFLRCARRLHWECPWRVKAFFVLQGCPRAAAARYSEMIGRAHVKPRFQNHHPAGGDAKSKLCNDSRCRIDFERQTFVRTWANNRRSYCDLAMDNSCKRWPLPLTCRILALTAGILIWSCSDRSKCYPTGQIQIQSDHP